MFSWFGRNKPAASAPPAASTPLERHAQNPANPGLSPAGEVKLSLTAQSWTEAFDCPGALAAVLERAGREPLTTGHVVEDPHSGYMFRALLVSCHAIGFSQISTTTTVEFMHPILFPRPVFEFQHAWGTTVRQSIEAGLDQWCQIDWPTLLDATRPTPQHCMQIQMELPATDCAPARRRRILFGPIAHLQPPQPPPPADGDHPFCPCCLFTKTMDAHKSLIESDETYAMRLFASRDASGTPDADCRLNGLDHPPGQLALRDYAKTWPAPGPEFRRQYAIIQTTPPAGERPL